MFWHNSRNFLMTQMNASTVWTTKSVIVMEPKIHTPKTATSNYDTFGGPDCMLCKCTDVDLEARH